jgi:hypothetical protein
MHEFMASIRPADQRIRFGPQSCECLVVAKEATFGPCCRYVRFSPDRRHSNGNIFTSCIGEIHVESVSKTLVKTPPHVSG